MRCREPSEARPRCSASGGRKRSSPGGHRFDREPRQLVEGGKAGLRTRGERAQNNQSRAAAAKPRGRSTASRRRRGGGTQRRDMPADEMGAVSEGLAMSRAPLAAPHRRTASPLATIRRTKDMQRAWARVRQNLGRGLACTPQQTDQARQVGACILRSGSAPRCKRQVNCMQCRLMLLIACCACHVAVMCDAMRWALEASGRLTDMKEVGSVLPPFMSNCRRMAAVPATERR